MKIEFYYFENCPSYEISLQNLKDVIKDSAVNAELDIIRIDSVEDAEKFTFQGSPSIKINGKDIEDRNDTYSFNCRLYKIEGKLTGVLTKEYLLLKLKDIAG